MMAATTMPPTSSIPLSRTSSSSKWCHSLLAVASRKPPVEWLSKLRMKTVSGSSFLLPSHAHITFNSATAPISRSLCHFQYTSCQQITTSKLQQLTCSR